MIEEMKCYPLGILLIIIFIIIIIIIGYGEVFAL